MSLSRRISNLFFRSKVEREINAELLSHLEMRTEDNLAAGMSPEEARRDARLRFGNPVVMKERTKAQDSALALEKILADIRYALRLLRKSPGFTATAVLTLALGIGANATVFSVLDAVLLRPLPFPAADRIVQVLSVDGGMPIGPSAPDMRDFIAQNHTFEKLAVYDQWRKNVSTSKAGENPEELLVGLAPGALFEGLGVQPIMGRLFTPDEGQAGRNHVALITDTFWKSHYQKDAKILGQTLTINDLPYTIVGVVPDIIPAWINASQNAKTRLPVWEPFLPTPVIWDEQSRGGRGYGAVGLLKPGVTMQQAQADLATIARNLAASFPVDREVGVAITPLVESRAGDLRPQLLLLMGAVALILLIACSNLAALLLARNTARQREFAMRVALGASRIALVRQILAETLLLALCGSVCGVGLAWLATWTLRLKDPGRLPQLVELTLDWRVLTFTLLAGVGTCIFFGLAPAILNTRVDVAGAIKDGGRSSSGASRQVFRKTLVVAQIALSLMLLVGAGLLLQTLRRLQNQDLGFRVDHLMRAHLYLPPAQYSTPESITRFCDRYTERLRVLPGVQDVSITTIYPPFEDWSLMFSIEGRPVSRLEDVPSALAGVVDTNYLRTAGIAVIEGRDFSGSDSEEAPRVAIVNQAFVRKYFPDEDPIGRQIELGAPASLLPKDEWMGAQRLQVKIAGVMRDTKDQGLALPVAPQLITLFRQTPPLNRGFKEVIVRSGIAPDKLTHALEAQLHALDPRLPLSEAQSMSDHLGDLTAEKRFTTIILTCFAGFGLVLAVIGVYGVISYLVAQRTQEIGIRLALGAPRAAVLWLISRQGLYLACAGVAIGLAGAVLTGHSMASLLYGISALDVVTFVSASIAMVVIALAASAIPARRAASIDPTQALRNE